MSVAIPTQISTGRIDDCAVYIQIKNGNVYRFNKPVPAAKAGDFMNRVMSEGQVRLSNWMRVR